MQLCYEAERLLARQAILGSAVNVKQSKAASAGPHYKHVVTI